MLTATIGARFVLPVVSVSKPVEKQPESVKDEAYWLEAALENWARSMRSDERPEGLPKQGSGGVTGYTHQGDSESAYIKLDIWLAERTNAAIEGLEPAEQCAIYVAYKVMAVYRMRDFAGALERGKAKVLKSLKARGVWMG